MSIWPIHRVEGVYHHNRRDKPPPHLERASTLVESKYLWHRSTPAVYSTNDRVYVVNRWGALPTPSPPPNELSRLRIDFRYGPHDPTLYPQMYDYLAPHWAWCEAETLHTDLYGQNITGYVLQSSDWKPLKGSISFGFVSRPVVDRLREAFYAIHRDVKPLMEEARHKLMLPTSTVDECSRALSEFGSVASTFRDCAVTVTRVQRGIVELKAFYHFRMDVIYHMSDATYVSDRQYQAIGAFTEDQIIWSMLHRMGLPSFLIIKELPVKFNEAGIVPVTDWSHYAEHRMLEAITYLEVSDPEPQLDDSQSSTRTRRSLSPAVSSLRARSRSPDRIRAKGPPSTLFQRQRRLAPADHVTATTTPVSRRAWIRRSLMPDTMHVLNPDADRPTWTPLLPYWIRDIPVSIDLSEERQQRLCAVDCVYPVPNEIFLEAVSALMFPAFYLTRGNDKSRAIAFQSWMGLRSFWFSRVVRERLSFDGLLLKYWRQICEGKYLYLAKDRLPMPDDSDAPDVVETTGDAAIAARAQELENSFKPVCEYVEGEIHAGTGSDEKKQEKDCQIPYIFNMAQAVVDGIPLELSGQSEEKIEKIMLERGLWTRESMWPARRAARDHYNKKMQPNGLPASASTISLAVTAQTDTSRPSVTTHNDPVFGMHPPLPSGKNMRSYMLGNHKISKDDLLRDNVRAYIMWELIEATFRLELRKLDIYILKSMNKWTPDIVAERENMWPRVWGRGNESFIPSGREVPLLTSVDRQKRLLGLRALERIMEVWPRGYEYKTVSELTHGHGDGLTDQSLQLVEKDVWRMYAQTYFDYFGTLPMFPVTMPPYPFEDPVGSAAPFSERTLTRQLPEPMDLDAHASTSAATLTNLSLSPKVSISASGMMQ